jgi:anti-sigma B factor antagonist
MEIPIENTDGLTVAEIPVRELDASNAADLKCAMARIFESHVNVVLDAGRMQFVDSSGLGAILSCLRQVSARGGDLKLCCLTRQVRATFELVRMHRIFDIFETREEALRAFPPANGGKR